MADHLRKQVRDAIKSIIVAAATAASARVYTGRVYPLTADGPWPQVTISSQGEQISTATMAAIGQRLYERTYRVNVIVHAKDPTDIEAVLDAEGVQIEVAIAANPTLGGKAKYVTLAGTQTELSEDAEQPAGSLTMAYDVEIYSRENTPDVLS
jgi:hypothetical protein